MMIRTKPVLPPDPDLIRVLERLESQLRRAADDLEEAFSVLRAIPPPVIEREPDPLHHKPTCGEWMPQARTRCARWLGHSPGCRSREDMDRTAERRRAKRAAS